MTDSQAEEHEATEQVVSPGVHVPKQYVLGFRV